MCGKDEYGVWCGGWIVCGGDAYDVWRVWRMEIVCGKDEYGVWGGWG